jgi:hypothetical protein
MNNIYLLILGLCFLIIGWFATGGSKSQFVRLVDVFIYGPILVYSAMLLKNRFLQIALLFIGTTTISYNLRNYLS